MFWNKKDNKDELPDLPPLKTPLKPAFDIPKPEALQNTQIPQNSDEDDDSEPQEHHGLPSFPDSPLQKGFAQTAIKDAISQSHVETPETEMPLEASSIKTMEMDMPEMPSSPSIKPQHPFTLEEPPERSYVAPRKPTLKPQQEIFVKLDKFNTSYRAITQIAKKVDEMDNALRKIREIKLREEQELAAWEKELSSLKSRLQEVSDTLFE